MSIGTLSSCLVSTEVKRRTPVIQNETPEVGETPEDGENPVVDENPELIADPPPEPIADPLPTPRPEPIPSPIPTPPPEVPPSYNCELKIETIVLANGSKKFPRTGLIVKESHLATVEDDFPQGRLFPRDSTEEVRRHYNRSCARINKKRVLSDEKPVPCLSIYPDPWDKEWTPPESGRAGQGSIGLKKPTVEQEMWSANMYWTGRSRPRPGEKFLITYNGRSVVVAMGFETGPYNKNFLGGAQPEVFWALKAQSESSMKLGRLQEQSLPYGPVRCRTPPR